MSTSRKKELLFAERSLFSAMQKLDPHLPEINRAAALQAGPMHLLMLNLSAIAVAAGHVPRSQLDELIELLADVEGLTPAALTAYAEFQIALTRHSQACGTVANSLSTRFRS